MVHFLDLKRVLTVFEPCVHILIGKKRFHELTVIGSSMNWRSSSQRCVDKLSTPDIYFYQELKRTLSIEAGESWISVRIDTVNSCQSDSSTLKYSSTTTTCSSVPSCEDPARSPSVTSTVSNGSESCGNMRQIDIPCLSSPKADLFFRQELAQIGAQPDNLLPYERIKHPNIAQDSQGGCHQRTKMQMRVHFSKSAGSHHSASPNMARTASWPIAAFESPHDLQQQDTPPLPSPASAASDDAGEMPDTSILSCLASRSSFRSRLPPGKMGLLFTDAAHSVLTSSFIKRVSP